MSRLHTTDAPPTPAQNSAERLNGKPAEPANGKPGEPHENANATDNQAKPSKDPGSSVERAEELTDKIAVNVAMFAANVGRKIVRLASHVGEALSDTWAEAQSIRRGKGK